MQLMSETREQKRIQKKKKKKQNRTKSECHKN